MGDDSRNDTSNGQEDTDNQEHDGSQDDQSNQGYIDLYLLPVKKDDLDVYKDQATEFGEVMLEYGCLGYREFKDDDLTAAEGGISYLQAVEVNEDEVLTVAVAEFKSRAHRDEVMQKVMADERIKSMEDEEPLADMTRMHYGGFQQFVKPQAS